MSKLESDVRKSDPFGIKSIERIYEASAKFSLSLEIHIGKKQLWPHFESSLARLFANLFLLLLLHLQRTDKGNSL